MVLYDLFRLFERWFNVIINRKDRCITFLFRLFILNVGCGVIWLLRSICRPILYKVIGNSFLFNFPSFTKISICSSSFPYTRRVVYFDKVFSSPMLKSLSRLYCTAPAGCRRADVVRGTGFTGLGPDTNLAIDFKSAGCFVYFDDHYSDNEAC